MTTIRITISIDTRLLKEIDRRRGAIKRSTYICMLLTKALKLSEEKVTVQI